LAEFSNFFAISRGNVIEGLNSQLRKVTNNKRVFPSDDSVFKILYLTIDYITRKWTMPIHNWGGSHGAFFNKIWR